MQAIVLTKSGKNGGICLAVYYPHLNQMFRLVTSYDGAEVPYRMCEKFEPLDVIEYLPRDLVVNGPQTENILIDTSFEIKKVEVEGLDITTIYNNLLENRVQSKVIFASNKSHIADLDFINHSLELVKVNNLVIKKICHNETIKIRADFTIDGIKHSNYAVTDFKYDIRKKEIDLINVGDAYLVVSISSKPYIYDDGTDYGYYKFVSAIYPI